MNSGQERRGFDSEIVYFFVLLEHTLCITILNPPKSMASFIVKILILKFK